MLSFFLKIMAFEPDSQLCTEPHQVTSYVGRFNSRTISYTQTGLTDSAGYQFVQTEIRPCSSHSEILAWRQTVPDRPTPWPMLFKACLIHFGFYRSHLSLPLSDAELYYLSVHHDFLDIDSSGASQFLLPLSCSLSHM